MNFEDVLPLMKKGIRCKCDGVYWTVDEHHNWLRWLGGSLCQIVSGPSNDQILGGQWEREGGTLTISKDEVWTPKHTMDRLEARLAYLERLHDVVWHDGESPTPPSYRQTMKHIGDLWRDCI